MTAVDDWSWVPPELAATTVNPRRTAEVLAQIIQGLGDFKTPAVAQPGSTTMMQNASISTPPSATMTSPSSATATGVTSQPFTGEAPVNSPFGQRSSGMHEGVDFGVPAGSAALAAISGTVTQAADNGDPNGYGTWVEITDANGNSVRYGHLSSLNVQPGQTVSAGQTIGITGGIPGSPGAGNSEGAHLHFEWRVNGSPIDPLPMLAGTAQPIFGQPSSTTSQSTEVTNWTPEEIMAAQLRNVGRAILGRRPDKDVSGPKKVKVKDTTTIHPGQGATPDEEGDLETWIRWAMDKKGVDESWFEGLYNRAMVESGGRNIPQMIDDINMQNGTPAFGPWQFIKSTFDAFAEPGYTDWQNPYHQALAIINAVTQSSKYGGHPSGLPRTGGWSP